MEFSVRSVRATQAWALRGRLVYRSRRAVIPAASRLWAFLQASVHGGARPDHGLDVGFAAADLAQDPDAVLAKLGRGIPLAARAARPLVGEPHDARLALGGVVLQLEEAGVRQMRVLEQAVQGVIRRRRYVGPVEDLQPLGGGLRLERGDADLEVLLHVGEARGDGRETRIGLELRAADRFEEGEDLVVGVGRDADPAVAGGHGLVE